jgi:hypothetical protein
LISARVVNPVNSLTRSSRVCRVMAPSVKDTSSA